MSCTTPRNGHIQGGQAVALGSSEGGDPTLRSLEEPTDLGLQSLEGSLQLCPLDEQGVAIASLES